MFVGAPGNASSFSSVLAFVGKFKLPRIAFKKFGGDLRDWFHFWGLFRKVDEDSTIDDGEEFQYLIQSSLPGSRARSVPESFSRHWNWGEKLGWDEELGGPIENDFVKWVKGLSILTQMKIPRHFSTSSTDGFKFKFILLVTPASFQSKITKPVNKLKSLIVGEQYKIHTAKLMQTKFGETVLLELKKKIANFSSKIDEVIFRGTKDVEKP
ncbi:hypothetical protein JTB14_005882 [Gonioctena quinquepunctata]|nr:hypothetical protein JTB14_005882 [Gonioctena quinquepunctata]